MSAPETPVWDAMNGSKTMSTFKREWRVAKRKAEIALAELEDDGDDNESDEPEEQE